jgi:hypothetical protein
MVLNPIKIYIKADGTRLEGHTTPIFRLSNHHNIIYVITPINNKSITKIKFRLANNVIVRGKPMKFIGTEEVTINSEVETWNVFKFSVDSATLAVCADFKSSPLKVSFSFQEFIPNLNFGQYSPYDNKYVDFDLEIDDYIGFFPTLTSLKEYDTSELENGDFAIVLFASRVVGGVFVRSYNVFYRYNGSAWQPYERLLVQGGTSQHVEAFFVAKAIMNTADIPLSIDPSIPSLPEDEEEIIVSTTDIVLEILSDLEVTMYENQASLFDLIPRVETLETDLGQAEVDIGDLDTRLIFIEGELPSEISRIETKIFDDISAHNLDEVSHPYLLGEVDRLDTKIETEIDTVDTRITNEVSILNGRIDTEVGTLNVRIDNEVSDLVDKDVKTIGFDLDRGDGTLGLTIVFNDDTEIYTEIDTPVEKILDIKNNPPYFDESTGELVLTFIGDIDDAPGVQYEVRIPANAVFVAHINDTTNPHVVTKTQVGLSNVTNDKQVKALGTPTVIGRVPAWAVTTGDALASGYPIRTATLNDSSTELVSSGLVKSVTDLLNTNKLNVDFSSLTAKTDTPITTDIMVMRDSGGTKKISFDVLGDYFISLLDADVIPFDGTTSIKDQIESSQEKIEVLQNNVTDHEVRIDSIEELSRKQDGDVASADDDGLGIIHLGNDVAEAPITAKVDGLLLDAPQLVPNGDFSDGTTGWTVFSGNIAVSSNELTYTVSSLSNSARIQHTLLPQNITDKIYISYYVLPKYNNILSPQFGGRNFVNITPIPNVWNFISIINSSNLVNTTDPLRLYNATDTNYSVNDIIKYKQVRVFNISTLQSNKQYSPMFNTTFDLMPDANIKTQMDTWVHDGTLPNDIMAVDMDKRIMGVGENLFDKGKYATNYAYKIKVKPSTEYTWSISALYKTYDINMVEVASGTNTTLTVGSGTHYIAFSGITNIDTFMLELGIVATTYEPYRSSSMYLDSGKVGYSLPNSTKDTIKFRNGKYYRVKRVNKSVMVINALITTPTNVDYVYFNKPSDSFANGQFSSAIGTYIVPPYIDLGSSTIDDVSNHWKTTPRVTGLSFVLVVPKGTYASLAEAQADLVGTDIYYQLVTPVETPISVIGNALSFPKGTFYIEDVVRRTGIYNAGITVDKAIKTLDNIYRLNADGSSTKLTGATVAGNGLSFTHASLNDGDFVWFDYYYTGTNVKGLTTLFYYGDVRIVQDDSDGKIYKVSFGTDNGVPYLIATEI